MVLIRTYREGELRGKLAKLGNMVVKLARVYDVSVHGFLMEYNIHFKINYLKPVGEQFQLWCKFF